MIKAGQILQNTQGLDGFFINEFGKYTHVHVPVKSLLIYLETTDDFEMSTSNASNWNTMSEFDRFWKKTVISRFLNESMMACLFDSKKIFVFENNFIKEHNV